MDSSLLTRYFFKHRRNLASTIIILAAGVMVTLLLAIVAARLKSPIPLFLGYLILIASFFLTGKEGGVIFGIYFMLVNVIFTVTAARGMEMVFTLAILLAVAVAFVYVLARYIDVGDEKEKGCEIRQADIEKDKVLLKEEYEKNVGMAQALKNRINNYVMLNEVAQRLVSTLDRSEIVSTVTGSMSKLTGSQAGVKFNLLIKNEETQLFELAGDEAQEKAMVSSAVKIYKNDPFDDWVEKNKYTLFIKNIEEDFRFKILRRDWIKFKSMISIPLIEKENVIGILKFFSAQPNVFDNEDVRLLNYLGDIGTTAAQNSLLFQKTKDLAIKDGLTGLYMRRYFVEKIDEEIRRAKQLGVAFSFLMIDIDHFKDCNDTHGHPFGDKVLKILSEFLRDNLRDVDVIGRYGGEEFAVILPSTPYNGAMFVAERLRNSFEKLVINVNENEGIKITLSVGGVEYREGMKLMEIINCADKALYHSKENGRNKVSFWEDIS
jgi:diguanylate cyclase (GGDEF)-like protein